MNRAEKHKKDLADHKESRPSPPSHSMTWCGDRKYTFTVTDDGRLQINGILVGGAEPALQLRDWLTATFDEEVEEDDSGSGVPV